MPSFVRRQPSRRVSADRRPAPGAGFGLAGILAALWVLSAPIASAAEASANASPPTFQEQVLPIFRDKCCSCHNPDKKKGGLDLTSHAQTLAGGSSGEVVAAGDADGSYLWMLVSHASEPKMPPESDRLSSESLDVIKRWIAGGAIERTGAKPVVRKGPAIGLSMEALPAVEGPAVMPPRLSLEPFSEAPRATTITALAVSPHGDLVVLGGRGQVLLFHAGSLELVGVLPFPEGVVKTVRINRTGKLLLAGGGEAAKSGRVVIWDVATAARIGELGDEYDEVLAADLSPDQRLVALGGPAKVVRLLASDTGEVQAELRKHTDWITAVGFSPRGEWLATGDRAGNLFLWEPDGGHEHGTLKGHTAAVTGMAWRPDGKALATVAEDGSVRLWDPGPATLLKTWQAHPGGAESVAWLGDGRIVTTGRDAKVKIWKPEGTLERESSTLSDIGTRVAVTVDGSRIFAGDWAGGVTVLGTADAAAAGTLDTNPPRLARRLELAEKLLAEASVGERTAADKAQAASAAAEPSESATDDVRKAAAQAEEELAAASARHAEAARQVDRWRAELEFSRSQAASR